MNIKRGLTAILLLAFAIIAGEKLCNGIGGNSEDYVYFKDGSVIKMKYVSINDNRDNQIQSRNYDDDDFGGEWRYYKRDIDSIVVTKDNFWTSGLTRYDSLINYNGFKIKIIWKLKK